MPRFLGNSPNIQSFENFQNLKNIPPSNSQVSGKFPKCLSIWEISQMPRFLGNSSNIQSFEIFPKSQKYSTLKFLGIWEISQMPWYLKIFPNAWVYGKFRKFLGIWEISKIPRHLGNPNTQTFGEFPKYLGFWEIPQISSHLRNFQNLKNIPPSKNTYRNLGNFPNAWVSGKFHVNAVVSCNDKTIILRRNENNS